jgi:C4-dicarboxylate-specific signal transduction histidine kinase
LFCILCYLFIFQFYFGFYFVYGLHKLILTIGMQLRDKMLSSLLRYKSIRNYITLTMKEELEDTKGRQSESVYRRRTDNTKEKVQTDKQLYTRHTHNTKNRVTRTPLKTAGKGRCSRRVSSSCSTNDTCRFNLVTNPVISHERGKDQEVFTKLDLENLILF